MAGSATAARLSPEPGMLYGAVMFAVAAAVAGMVGFGGFASAPAALARILLFVLWSCFW
jgi:uncharacterized membrane protein YtjA (UPF0391 family)